MKRTVLPLLALVVLSLVGCGGSSPDSDGGPSGDSPFAGAYDVVLTREGSDEQIEGEIIVDQDGDVTGSFAGEGFQTAEIRGEVSNSGDFAGTSTQSGGETEIEGDFALDANSNLVGTIRQEDGGEVFETMLAGTRR